MREHPTPTTAQTTPGSTRTDLGKFSARLVTPLVASALLNPINSTLIAVALIPIGQTFDAGPRHTAWLISGLYLATAIGQPVAGLLVDRFGPRRALLAGAGTVGIAGIAGMLALSLDWLIGVRVVLGIGTCAGFPAAMAVLRRHAETHGRGIPARVLSILAISAQTIMVLGPTLGGVLIGVFGWPAVFAVNIPLAALALLFALLWVPPDRDTRTPSARRRIDVAGVVLFTLSMIAILLYVMEPRVTDLYLVAVAVVFGAAFVLVELRHPQPFLDIRELVGQRALLRTYARQALSFLIIYSIMFGYVQWLESSRGFSESGAGALLLPMSGVAVVGAALSGRATGVLARLVVTAVALLVGSGLLLLVDSATPVGALIGIGAVFGVAQGLTSVTNQTALYAQASAGMIGTASGLFRTAQYFGAIAASTLISLCYGQHASSAGLHHLAIALLAIGAVLLVVTVVDRSLRRVPAP